MFSILRNYVFRFPTNLLQFCFNLQQHTYTNKVFQLGKRSCSKDFDRELRVTLSNNGLNLKLLCLLQQAQVSYYSKVITSYILFTIILNLSNEKYPFCNYIFLPVVCGLILVKIKESVK